MSGEIAIFPAELLDKDQEEKVVLFLQQLPVPLRRKKQALVAWTTFTGAALTEKLVERILGPLAYRVQG